MKAHFEPPDDWLRIRTIDAHTAGEPLRVIVDGWPEIEGETILAKRRFARGHHEHLRRALMLEPRGHADMYGCILTAPVTSDGDVGVLFLHNEGYSTMCGHGIIGLVKVGIEAGMIEAKPEIRIDTPAGRVTASARMEAGRVLSVSFLNVPSFLVERDRVIGVDGVGKLRVDVGYGGAYYAYVDAEEVGLELEPKHFASIVDLGMRIKRACTEEIPLRHPSGDTDLDFFYGTIFVQRLAGKRHSRNCCVFAEGEVDRSPTGTGVSGRAAIHHARGELALGESIVIESLIGTPFEVRVAQEIDLEGQPAIVPEVTGEAHITGQHEFWIDPKDPLREGFLLR